MSEQRRNADDIEQRYVAEYRDAEELVEGLDPDKPRERKTVDEVEAVGDDVEDDIEEMTDPER